MKWALIIACLACSLQRLMHCQGFQQPVQSIFDLTNYFNNMFFPQNFGQAAQSPVFPQNGYGNGFSGNIFAVGNSVTQNGQDVEQSDEGSEQSVIYEQTSSDGSVENVIVNVSLGGTTNEQVDQAVILPHSKSGQIESGEILASERVGGNMLNPPNGRNVEQANQGNISTGNGTFSTVIIGGSPLTAEVTNQTGGALIVVGNDKDGKNIDREIVKLVKDVFVGGIKDRTLNVGATDVALPSDPANESLEQATASTVRPTVNDSNPRANRKCTIITICSAGYDNCKVKRKGACSLTTLAPPGLRQMTDAGKFCSETGPLKHVSCGLQCKNRLQSEGYCTEQNECMCLQGVSLV